MEKKSACRSEDLRHPGCEPWYDVSLLWCQSLGGGQLRRDRRQRPLGVWLNLVNPVGVART